MLPQRNDLRSEARSLQRGASLRSSPPQRSEESTAHMHVYSAGVRRGARSTVKRGVYSAGFRRGTSLRSSPPQRNEESAVSWNSGSLRNFTAELTSAAKRGSTAWIFIAELYLHAKRGASKPISVIITIILVISPSPERTRAQT